MIVQLEIFLKISIRDLLKHMNLRTIGILEVSWESIPNVLVFHFRVACMLHFRDYVTSTIFRRMKASIVAYNLTI